MPAPKPKQVAPLVEALFGRASKTAGAPRPKSAASRLGEQLETEALIEPRYGRSMLYEQHQGEKAKRYLEEHTSGVGSLESTNFPLEPKIANEVVLPDRARIQGALGVGQPEGYRYYGPGDVSALARTKVQTTPAPSALRGEVPYEVALERWAKDPNMAEMVEGVRSVLRGDNTPVEILNGPLSRREIGRLAALAADTPIFGGRMMTPISGYGKTGEGKLFEAREGVLIHGLGLHLPPHEGLFNPGGEIPHGQIVGRVVDEIGAYTPKELRAIGVTHRKHGPGTPAGHHYLGRAGEMAHEVGHAIHGIRDKRTMYAAYMNILGMTEDEVLAILREELMPLVLSETRRGTARHEALGLFAGDQGRKFMEYVTKPQELLADGVMVATAGNPELLIRRAPRFAKSLAALSKADPQVGAIYTTRALLPLAAAGAAVAAASSGAAGMVNEIE